MPFNTTLVQYCYTGMDIECSKKLLTWLVRRSRYRMQIDESNSLISSGIDWYESSAHSNKTESSSARSEQRLRSPLMSPNSPTKCPTRISSSAASSPSPSEVKERSLPSLSSTALTDGSPCLHNKVPFSIFLSTKNLIRCCICRGFGTK